MPLASQGPISIDSVRNELNKPIETSFSLNTAEDGGYVAINQCSTYKPSATNPVALSEWYNYNHGQSCGSSEFAAVECDVFAGICDAVFVPSTASSTLVMTPANGMSPDDDGLNDLWYINNANKYPNARFMVMKYLSSTQADIVFNFTGTYTPWNGVGNVGAYAGVKLDPYPLYFFKIDYNDGTGRVIGTTTITNNNTLVIDYPVNGEIVTKNFTSSTVSSAAACSATNTEPLSFVWPITTAGGLFPAGQTGGNYVQNRAGYFRLQGAAGNWVRIDSLGYIISRGTC